jgi:hypothetical protein
VWLHQVIEVHVELRAAERDQPAVPVLFDLALARRFEILAIKTR